jgi:hypothetical protein
VVQFYSWRDAALLDDLSVEWMYPYVKLAAGQTWSTTYVMRYLRSVKPPDLLVKPTFSTWAMGQIIKTAKKT